MQTLKATPDQLAIFGHKPAFFEQLHVGKPTVGDREALFRRLGAALDRGWLTNAGPLVREFEEQIETITGVRHCVAMCNGTVALEIVARAAGLSGEVIMPSFTFVATAHAIQWQEMKPVFCDIDRRTHTIDPERVEELITPKTTAIIGVHLWGRPCNVSALQEIARRRGLKLIFDAAHAFGCAHEGRMIGGFGDAEVLSFHATKCVNAGEGGAVLTNDDQLAEKLRLMRNFGFAYLDKVVYIGINGKMSEMAAALGLTSLDEMVETIRINERNYRAYKRGLEGIEGVHLLDMDGQDRSNYQYVVVEVDRRVAGLSRDQLVTVLMAENIRVRRYFHPGCHRMEPYRSLYPHAHFLLPRTEDVTDRVLVLPTGPAVDEESILKICTIIRTAVEHSHAIGVRLSECTFLQ